MKKIIAIFGVKNSGKNYLARCLMESPYMALARVGDVVECGFADPLKRCVARILGINETYALTMSRADKEAKIYKGRSFRDWCRAIGQGLQDQFGQTYWVDQFLEMVCGLPENTVVVVNDGRHPGPEYAYLYKASETFGIETVGALVVRKEALEQSEGDDHPSEAIIREYSKLVSFEGDDEEHTFLQKVQRITVSENGEFDSQAPAFRAFVNNYKEGEENKSFSCERFSDYLLAEVLFKGRSGKASTIYGPVDVLRIESSLFEIDRVSVGRFMETISKSLAGEQRWLSQFCEGASPRAALCLPLSVAEHSILLAEVARDVLDAPGEFVFKNAALVHDMSEAFLRDLPHHVKSLMPDYCALEAIVTKQICQILGVDIALLEDPRLKKLDRDLGTIEGLYIGAADAQLSAEGVFSESLSKRFEVVLEKFRKVKEKRGDLIVWRIFYEYIQGGAVFLGGPKHPDLSYVLDGFK